MVNRVLPLALLLCLGCSKLPKGLFESGLYAEADPTRISEGVVAFEPRFPLWSDGATKRRWIKLPPGQQIDSSDPDHWVFPEGTQLWKEFSRDGQRVETRLLQKFGPDSNDWDGVAYVWNEAQTQAKPVSGGQQNAGGTDHDIPAGFQCKYCHEGSVEWPLGVTAVQLASGESQGLAALLDADAFTDPPARVTIPGSPETQHALGYLHANCGSCHHADYGDYANLFFDPPADFELRLLPSELGSLGVTGTYRTGVGQAQREEFQGTTVRIAPGDPDNSGLFRRMQTRGGESSGQMPVVGSEDVDSAGLAAVRTWIEGL